MSRPKATAYDTERGAWTTGTRTIDILGTALWRLRDHFPWDSDDFQAYEAKVKAAGISVLLTEVRQGEWLIRAEHYSDRLGRFLGSAHATAKIPASHAKILTKYSVLPQACKTVTERAIDAIAPELTLFLEAAGIPVPKAAT